jgi:hypothetical protein
MEDPDSCLWEESATAYFNVYLSDSEAAKTFSAAVSFEPSVWQVGMTENVTARISSIDSHSVNDVNLSTIMLNGWVPIISGSSTISDGVLTVQFDGTQALESAGTFSGDALYPTVEGRLNQTDIDSTDRFSGKGRVETEGATILRVKVDKHTVGAGTYPGSTKEPLDGVEVRIYSKAQGSCAAGYGISWQHYPEIWDDCEWVVSGRTQSGVVSFYHHQIPPGDYLAIGYYDGIYIGVSVGSLPKDEVVEKYLQVIVNAKNKKLPGKYRKLSGSELLIIEPEYVEWSEESELYPFIFESVGDWSVTTSIEPPEGFVADQDQLEVDVYTDLKAAQFTVTDVGTTWVKSKVKHKVKHKGKAQTIDSEIGIKLTPALAKMKKVGVYGEEDKDKDKDKYQGERKIVSMNSELPCEPGMSMAKRGRGMNRKMMGENGGKAMKRRENMRDAGMLILATLVGLMFALVPAVAAAQDPCENVDLVDLDQDGFWDCQEMVPVVVCGLEYILNPYEKDLFVILVRASDLDLTAPSNIPYENERWLFRPLCTREGPWGEYSHHSILFSRSMGNIGYEGCERFSFAESTKDNRRFANLCFRGRDLHPWDAGWEG